MKHPNRETITDLEQLPNIGKAMARDLHAVGIQHPGELVGKGAFQLYDDLCTISGTKHDPCVIDIFMSAINFMEGGEPRPWWSFTGERKNLASKMRAVENEE